MIVRGVKLVNVLSHENTEVRFPDGVVSIVGPNGAGKSSLVDSIYLALFSDVKPDIRGGKKEFIVMRGKGRGEISVEFEVGGRRYLAVRRIDVSGSSDALLYEVTSGSRKLVAERVPNVVREVGRVMGLSTYATSELRRLVRATILALQDELTQIIDVTDSERKEWVLSLLGLSYLEKALEGLRNYTKELRKELEARRGEKLRKLEELRREVEEAKAKIREVERELGEYEGRLVEEEGRVREYEDRLGVLDYAVDLCYQLRSGLVLRRVSELEGMVRLLEPVEGWDPDVLSLREKDLKRKSAELERVERELGEALESLARSLGTQLKDPEDVGKVYKELEEQVRELSERVGGYRELANLYTQMLSKLEIGESCPVCGSRIGDPEEVRRRLRKVLSEMEGRSSLLAGDLEKLREKLSLLEGRYPRLSRLIASRESLRRDVQSAREELEHIVSRAEELCGQMKVEFRGVEECFNALKSMKDELRRARAELDVLKKMFTGSAPPPSEPVDVLRVRLAESLSKLGITLPSELTPESLDRLVSDELKPVRRRLEQELRVARDELGRLRVKLGELRTLLGTKKEEVEKLEGEISSLEGEVRELDRRLRAVDLVERFGEVYLGKDGLVARGLTKVVRSELERRANRVLGRLGLPHIKIGEGFEVSVVLPTGELPVRNASGGERVGISIALRLALAEIVMGRAPTALILDEPTIYLDESRRSQVFDIIKELGRSLKQVVVVTHDESVVNVSEKVITVENIGGISRVLEGTETSTRP